MIEDLYLQVKHEEMAYKIAINAFVPNSKLLMKYTSNVLDSYFWQALIQHKIRIVLYSL